MFYPANIEKYIEENKLKHIFEKAIPKDLLKQFHMIVNNKLKEGNFIIKGSRSLNKKIDIYTEEEIQYVDYDLYSKNPKKDLVDLAKTLYENGIKEITVENIIFKSEIYRLKFYTIPLIDVEPLSDYEWEMLPKVDGYVDQNFQKIDMYVQMGRPTILNVSNWEKVLPRLKKIEDKLTYEKYLDPKSGKLNNNIKIIMEFLDNDVLITGNVAYYYHLMKFKDNVYFPDIKYLEIYTHRTSKYINLMKRHFNNVSFATNDNFMNLYTKCVTVYINESPILYMYNLDDCISYKTFDYFKYSSYYHLMFYLNMVKYLFPSDYKITETMLYYLYKYGEKELKTNFFGNRNPGVMELRNMFIKKKKETKLFRWSPSNS